MIPIKCVAGVVFCTSMFVYFANAATDGPPNGILDDPRRLEAYVSSIVTNRMEKGHVPGAVVTIVRGDKVVLNKGYGFANLKEKRRVDPENTLFRIASVSKVFNAMAAMKLVDQGKIDLGEDVCPRLSAAGLVLDSTAEGPITLRGLLTHSAGIRETYIPEVTLNQDATKVSPLASYLRRCLPLRWIPEGEAGLYTDHGITLAGYLIELISRKRFQEFVRTSVMRPLGMKRSCYAGPGMQLRDVAIGYSYSDAGYQAADFYYTSIDPAIGVLTTGSDMGRLIIAHLAGKPRLFSSETMKMMHEAQYSDDARLGFQWSCGFFKIGLEKPFLVHYGAALDFASQVAILPEAQIGCFVSQNSEAQLVFHVGDLQALAGTNKLHSPESQTYPLPALTEGSDLDHLAGTYVANRTLSRGTPLEEQDFVKVKHVKEAGALEVEHWQNRDRPVRFVETARLLFRAVDGDQRISFRKSMDGKRTYLFDFSFTGDGQHSRISIAGHPSSTIDRARPPAPQE